MKRTPQSDAERLALLDKINTGRKVKVYAHWAPKGLEGAIIKQAGRVYLAHTRKNLDGSMPVLNDTEATKVHHDLPHCLELIVVGLRRLEVLKGSYSIRTLARTFWSEYTGRWFYITHNKVISGCHAVPHEDVKKIAELIS